MICYIYDDTFEGLLTSIYEAYYRKEKPEEIFSNAEFQPTLLTEPVFIESNEEKYIKVYDAIENKISKESLEMIYHVYLSELKGCGTLIYKYIRLGFKLRSSVNLYLHNNIVLNMHKLEKKVIYECHRMLGFVRFNLTENLYYSAIEPEYNILSLIASHFVQRLPNENWIIHDLKRECAIFHNKSQWIIAPFSKENFHNFFKTEDTLYEALWKEFFHSIAVENRINPKLQKRQMPARYWKHLTELKP